MLLLLIIWLLMGVITLIKTYEMNNNFMRENPDTAGDFGIPGGFATFLLVLFGGAVLVTHLLMYGLSTFKDDWGRYRSQ